MLRPITLLAVLKLCQVHGMSDLIKELLTPARELGESCGYASCNPSKPDHINVHIVPHTHAELGHTRTFYGYYTGDDDLYESTTMNMKRILDYTISELWSSTHRKFTFSDMPYLFYWWTHRDETVRRMVYELIRQGRLSFVGGGWSMSDESTTSYHAIIEHFTYSLRKLNNSFLECARPLVAWQVDVVGHSREFASLMAQMGYDGLFVAPVGHDDELNRLFKKEMEFLWRGSDDLGPETDIFTHIPFDGMLPPPGFCFSSFCHDPLLITSSEALANILERAEVFLDSMKHRQAPSYSSKNVLVLMGGRFAYSDAGMWFENIDKLIQVVNTESHRAHVHAFYSTPACYLRAVYDESPTLRTKQDDFYPQAIDKTAYATGAYSSRPSLKYLAREGHRYLQISKQLMLFSRLLDNYQFFEDFHWINGVFQDHHVITGELRPHVLSFYVERMDTMVQQSVLLIKDAFNKLRHSPDSTSYYKCPFNISWCINTSGPHPFIVIYNPLAWPVSMFVRLPIRDREYTVYSPEGERLEAATMPIPRLVRQIPGRNSTLDTELIFLAKDLPPLGYRSYYYRKRELGWERPKRSLIKKINQKKPKKYLVRQTNASPDDEQLFNEPEYEYFEDTTVTSTPKVETKIFFGNVSRNENDSVYNDVLTPKSKWEAVTEVPTTTTEKTTVTTTTSTTTTTENYKSTIENYNYTTVPVTTSTTKRPTTTKAPVTRTTPRPTPTTTTPTTPRREESDTEGDEDENFWKGYEYMRANITFIRNRYIRVNLDPSGRIRNISVASGARLPFDVQMVYYVADDPHKLGKPDVRPPGAYVFRSMDNKQERIAEAVVTGVYKSKLAQEVHCALAPHAGFVLRLHLDSPVLEVDWIVGPIPVDDGLGKDVFIKYVTNIDNKGVFYTDSNGRQTIKRIRNARPTYRPLNKDPVAGNIYPVTSKIYIEDLKRNIRFSVLNDRSQGGSSLKDGEINIMLHRRLLTEDPVKENLNETEFGKGLVVRGTHYLYISKADYKPTNIFEKKLAKEIELRPQIFVSSVYGYGVNTKNIWKKHRNEYSALKSKLPLGIHVLTIEKWTPTTVLLRLENYLEKQDAVLSGVKSVYLNNIFKYFKFTSVQEMTLAANIPIKDWTPLDWKKQLFLKSFNDAYGNGTEEYSEDTVRGLEDVDLDKPVLLSPQQIRTFILTYTFM